MPTDVELSAAIFVRELAKDIAAQRGSPVTRAIQAEVAETVKATCLSKEVTTMEHETTDAELVEIMARDGWNTGVCSPDRTWGRVDGPRPLEKEVMRAQMLAALCVAELVITRRALERAAHVADESAADAMEFAAKYPDDRERMEHRAHGARNIAYTIRALK